MHCKKSIPSEIDKGADFTINRIVETARNLIMWKGLTRNAFWGCGIGAPAPLDTRRTMITKAVNLPGWVNIPIKGILEKRLKMPVILENDANVAAYGEKWVGAGKKAHTLVLYTLGTGIGGGIVIEDKLWVGAFGGGAEIGHSIIKMDGELCGCGNKGCIEAYASATALVGEFKKAIESGKGSTTDFPEEATAKDICNAAKNGNPIALKLIKNLARYLGTAIASIVHIIEPELIIISGGLAQAGDILLKPVREETRKRIFTQFARKVKIVKGKLGEDAGIIGAAGWALRCLKN